MKAIKYGLIGAGMMGQEHIRNIALHPGASVAAFVEPDEWMAGAAQALIPDAVRETDLTSILKRNDLDCLLIASPNFCHADQIAEIAATRPLPLLVEKPLFTNPEDADRLLALGRAYPAPIWVAMEYRYMPPIADLLARADEITGGIKMLTIREHRFPFLQKVNDWNRFNKYSGGTFVEKCCHFFDLMRLIMKDEPVRIMASAGQAVNHLDETYEGQTPDILDHGYVIVEFAGGGRAMLDLCMFAEASEYQEDVIAVGPNGKIEAHVPGPGRFWPDEAGPAPEPMVVEHSRIPRETNRRVVPVRPELLAAGDHNGATYYQHGRFLALLRGEIDAPDVSFADGWSAVAMGLAAQKSASSGLVTDIQSLP